MPPDASPETSGAILTLMLLVSVAFSVDAHREPGRLVMLAFFVRLFRTLNWRTSGQFIKVFSARPK